MKGHCHPLWVTSHSPPTGYGQGLVHIVAAVEQAVAKAFDDLPELETQVGSGKPTMSAGTGKISGWYHAAPETDPANFPFFVAAGKHSRSTIAAIW